MPVNEPGEYLDAPDLAYANEVEDPEQRAEVVRELAKRQELRGKGGDDPGE